MNKEKLCFPGLKNLKVEGYNGVKLIDKYSIFESLNSKTKNSLPCFIIISLIVMIILIARSGSSTY